MEAVSFGNDNVFGDSPFVSGGDVKTIKGGDIKSADTTFKYIMITCTI